MAQTSDSHCLSCFLKSTLPHLDHYLPFTTAEGKLCVVNEFYTIVGLPNMIDCVQGPIFIEVPLLTPCSLPMLYRNRHGYHTPNVQVTCDAEGLIHASLPSSQSVSTSVFQESTVNQLLVLWAEGKGWLLHGPGRIQPIRQRPYAWGITVCFTHPCR